MQDLIRFDNEDVLKGIFACYTTDNISEINSVIYNRRDLFDVSILIDSSIGHK